MPSSDRIRFITLGGGADPPVTIFTGASDRIDTYEDRTKITVTPGLQSNVQNSRDLDGVQGFYMMP